MTTRLRCSTSLSIPLALVFALAACAKGTGIDDTSEGSGDGGSSGSVGDGGSVGATPATGTGTTSGSFGSGTTTSTTTSAGTTSTTSTTSGGTITSSSATTSAGSTTGSGVTTSNGSTTSAGTTTGGGSNDCDPLNPALDCGSGQQCVPQPAPAAPVCEPAGLGGAYELCFGRDECAPSLECVNDGIDTCCMAWCRVGVAGDCGANENCEPLLTPPEVNGVEYGVCWDGLPCLLF